MDELIYSVELSDGTVIDGLKFNGNNFVSLTEVDPSIFENNAFPVVITATADGEEPVTESHPYMELVQVTKVGNEWWFILRDIPDGELAETKLRADVDYIALMTDVELEL